MSAAGSPNDAAHAFHRLGRHPGTGGRHQLERWVVMLSEWWVAMLRYAHSGALRRQLSGNSPATFPYLRRFYSRMGKLGTHAIHLPIGADFDCHAHAGQQAFQLIDNLLV